MLFFPLNFVRTRIPVARILLPLLLLTGCGDSEDVQYNNTRTQILRRLFDNLTRGESDQALREIERLRALTEPSSFFRQVEEHERIRKQLADTVLAMRNGHPDEALPKLRRLDHRFPGTESIAKSLRNCRALNALQNTVRKLPASWAEQQQATLAELEPYRDILATTSAFQKWHAEQQNRLSRMRQSERAEARRQLRSELDFALVSHRTAAPLVLAQLAAVDADTRSALEQRARHNEPLYPSNTILPLETALCLLGSGNPADAYVSTSSRDRTAWRSQRLLAALNSARREKWSPAFRQLSEIHLESPLDSRYISAILTSFLPDGTNWDQPPQATPCPSVSEMLQMIADISR